MARVQGVFGEIQNVTVIRYYITLIMLLRTIINLKYSRKLFDVTYLQHDSQVMNKIVNTQECKLKKSAPSAFY